MPWVTVPRLGKRGSRNQTDYIRVFKPAPVAPVNATQGTASIV